MKGIAAAALLGSALIMAGAPAYAGNGGPHYFHSVLLDVDSNPGTGCSVNVQDANIDTAVAGIDQMVTMEVAVAGDKTDAEVTSVDRFVCDGGSMAFAGNVDPGTWNVGNNNGLNGSDVVEGYVPRALIGNPGNMRVIFSSTINGTSDVMLAHVTNSVPALSTPWIALAVLVLAMVGAWTLRNRRRVLAIAVLVGALAIGGPSIAVFVYQIKMDGNTGDWDGIRPVGTDPNGDSSIGDDAEDIVAGFSYQDEDRQAFRVDIFNIIVAGPPPCVDADSDTYGAGCPNGPDCNDGNASINPGAAEVCDGIDNDCNDLTTESGLTPPGGCSNSGVCSGQTIPEVCFGAGGWRCDYTGVPFVDLDQNANLTPIENSCFDGLDNNCNGMVDDGCPP